MLKRILSRSNWLFWGFVFLVLSSALTYLPNLHKVSYLYDDWYLMYAAQVKGITAFFDIFRIDRPMRALVMMPAYLLFGDNPFYYNLNAYLMRLLSAFGLWWALRMLWPRAHSFTFVTALFFLLYPGFLSQLNGIDYQSQMVSLAAATISIALSFYAALNEKPVRRFFAILFATMLGWFYMGLVEYEIGLEAFRFLGLYILSRHETPDYKKALGTTWKQALINLHIPLVFLFFRVFIFKSARRATNIAYQLVGFVDSPFLTSVRWLFQLLEDLWEVIFLAWGGRLGVINSGWRIRELLLMAGIALALAFLLYFLLRSFFPKEENNLAGYPVSELLLFGIITVVSAQIPVIMVGRQVNFTDFSRYALAGSAGAALLLSGILHAISPRRLRFLLISIFLTVAVFTHQANTLRFAQITETMRNFWWQVSWRVPQIAEGTTLVAHYTPGAIPEDYVIWSPANMIYYPKKGEDPVSPTLSAMIPNQENFLILAASPNKVLFRNRRSIHVFTDLSRILVLSQPGPNSCVHILDGKQLEVSPFEKETIMLFAQYSDVTTILTKESFHTPPSLIFGSEPAHGWCYYYQRASLARQQQDWDSILLLADKVESLRLKPSDPIEWLPFLEAYARENYPDKVEVMLDAISQRDRSFTLSQACHLLQRIAQNQEISQVVDKYCADF